MNFHLILSKMSQINANFAEKLRLYGNRYNNKVDAFFPRCLFHLEYSAVFSSVGKKQGKCLATLVGMAVHNVDAHQCVYFCFVLRMGTFWGWCLWGRFPTDDRHLSMCVIAKWGCSPQYYDLEEGGVGISSLCSDVDIVSLCRLHLII